MVQKVKDLKKIDEILGTNIDNKDSIVMRICKHLRICEHKKKG